MVNAATESASYVTASCFLQGKVDKDGEWETLDYVNGNKQNIVNRMLSKPAKVRYLRLLVTQPLQNPSGTDTRIYELEVYE